MSTLHPQSVFRAEDQRRLQIAVELRELIENDVRSTAEMRRLAQKFEVGLRTLYRWRERLTKGGLLTTALVPTKPGPRPGSSRYPPELDELIAAVLRKDGLTRQNIPLAALVRRVQDECRKAGFAWRPGRKGIEARFYKIAAHDRAQRREGRRAAERYTPRPGEFPETTAPNQVWLIDHTLVDQILVDRRFRQPLGRATLTAIIDAYTRMMAGYFLSLGKPSTVQVAMALMHAMLPKEAWLAELGVRHPWPIHGVPAVLHADNAVEFHSAALRRACLKHDIDPQYRAEGAPHWGSLIERAIGTFMGEVHLLPGTTFSSVARRGDYDSAKTSVMTLDEFDRWFALQVTAYHAKGHRGIADFTPRSIWEQAAYSPRTPRSGYGADFLIDFMPEQRRQLRPTGIHIFGLRYWADWLATDLMAGRQHVLVRHDERDISCIFVEDQAGTWQPVHLWRRREPFSRREHETARAIAKAQALATHDEELLYQIREEQRALVETASRKTARARRNREEAERGFALSLPSFVPVEPPTAPVATRLPLIGDGDGDDDVEVW